MTSLSPLVLHEDCCFVQLLGFKIPSRFFQNLLDFFYFPPTEYHLANYSGTWYIGIEVHFLLLLWGNKILQVFGPPNHKSKTKMEPGQLLDSTILCTQRERRSYLDDKFLQTWKNHGHKLENVCTTPY